MPTKTVETKTAFSGVRPPRIATLVSSSTTNWEIACQHIIQFYSQCWGGAFNIIVPTDGNTIDPKFHDILDVFDADYIYCYGSHRIFDISHRLAREVQARFAPMLDGDDVIQSARVLPDGSPSWPLTTLSSFMARHARRIVTLSANITSIPKLWYQAVTGDIGDRYSEHLGNNGMTHDPIQVTEENAISLIYFVLSPRNRSTREAALDHAIQALGVRSIDLHAVEDIFPFAHSMHGLSFYTPTPLLRRQPKAIVAGRTIEDFCLYYAL